MDELPAGVNPFSGFTFNPNQIISAAQPVARYTTTMASLYEVCQHRGLRKGAVLRMINRINGSPQGIGSEWLITDMRIDTDRITIQPIGAKGGCPILRKLPLRCIKADFIPIGFLKYDVSHV